MKKIFILILALFLMLLFGCQVPAGSQLSEQFGTVDQYSDSYGEELGTVSFPISCNEQAKKIAERGLALLHHMTYDGAMRAFFKAIKADPDCAMAYWGQAMTFIHPLWSDQPSKNDFLDALAYLQQAQSRGEKTYWEQAYITAAKAYYDQGSRSDEKENLVSFERAWEKVYQQFPNDPEAASFYALSKLATVDPQNNDRSQQKLAADIAKEVLVRVPDHPGAHHYIIHAYDDPVLAHDALAVARSYGAIASNVSHTLHMPSHIFTRLGLWQESIEMNRRAADMALKHSANGLISLHYHHALDYLIYAFLQRADDQAAKNIVTTMQSLNAPSEVHIATAFAFAAIPARFALEQHQWAMAAKLEPRVPHVYPWDEFPAMEAITHFARALGAARTGRVQPATQAIGQLEQLRQRVSRHSDYWTRQIDIQRLSAQAWLLYHQDHQQDALVMMRQAAGMESDFEKHPVSPGMILPAEELLADMYYKMGRYREALVQYQATLKKNSNRFNSLDGAARAAKMAGEKKVANSYYNQLVESSASDTRRVGLLQARNFLNEN